VAGGTALRCSGVRHRAVSLRAVSLRAERLGAERPGTDRRGTVRLRAGLHGGGTQLAQGKPNQYTKAEVTTIKQQRPKSSGAVLTEEVHL
jgi:hypothetical protein